MNGKKRCACCLVEKESTDFAESKRSSDGLFSYCRVCRNKKQREYVSRNRDAVNARQRVFFKIYSEKNRQKLIEKNRKYRQEHPEEAALSTKKYADRNKLKLKKINQAWYLKNRDRILKNQREYRASNIDKVREKQRERMTEKRKDSVIRFSQNISGAIYRCLKGKKCGMRTESILLSCGYTPKQLKEHIERLWKPGMAWDNYGSKWELDHKIPIAVFNFDSVLHEDFWRCWSLSNLQPLWSEQNRSKKAKIEKPFQPFLPLEVPGYGQCARR